MPTLHNGCISLSKPRSRSALTSHLTHYSHPNRACHTLQSDHKFAYCCLYKAVWQFICSSICLPHYLPSRLGLCLQHLWRGWESEYRIISKPKKASKEIPVEKSPTIREEAFNEVFSPTVNHCYLLSCLLLKVLFVINLYEIEYLLSVSNKH